MSGADASRALLCRVGLCAEPAQSPAPQRRAGLAGTVRMQAQHSLSSCCCATDHASDAGHLPAPGGAVGILVLPTTATHLLTRTACWCRSRTRRWPPPCTRRCWACWQRRRTTRRPRTRRSWPSRRCRPWHPQSWTTPALPAVAGVACCRRPTLLPGTVPFAGRSKALRMQACSAHYGTRRAGQHQRCQRRQAAAAAERRICCHV